MTVCYDGQRSVYFARPIGELGPVKIGCATMVEARLKQMLTWSPLPLEIVAQMPGGYTLERRFHIRFQDDRLHSEWFRWSPELQAAIDAVAAGGFDTDTLPLTLLGRAA